VVEARYRLTRHRGGQPDGRNFADIDSVKCRRRNADHRHRMAIHEELASDYIRSTFEFCLPKVVRENDYGIRVGRTMVFAGQDASCNRTDAEYLKIIAGHHLCGHRLSVAERGDADRREGTAKDPLEKLLLLVEVAADWI